MFVATTYGRLASLLATISLQAACTEPNPAFSFAHHADAGLADGAGDGLAAPDGACGNGVLDPGERCDPAIASGSGACPRHCAPRRCQLTRLTGQGCQLGCVAEPITQCLTGDGCCPAGCSHEVDADCAQGCGNGVVEPDELCDPAASAEEDRCPTPASCTSDDPCAVAQLSGSGCNVTCERTTISSPFAGDGCCPAGADHALDADCPAKQYGELCSEDAECASWVCHRPPYCSPGQCTCTEFCQPGGPIGQCGGGGQFCLLGYTDTGPVCGFIVDTGDDGDDSWFTFGTTFTATVDSPSDVDVFVSYLSYGTHTFTVIPKTAWLDPVIEIFDNLGKSIYVGDFEGLGTKESVTFNVQYAGEGYYAVRSASGTGSYEVQTQ